MSPRQKAGILGAGALIALLVAILVFTSDGGPWGARRYPLSAETGEQPKGAPDELTHAEPAKRDAIAARPPIDPESAATVRLTVQVIFPRGAEKEVAELHVWEVLPERPETNPRPSPASLTDPSIEYYDKHFRRPDAAWNEPAQVGHTDASGVCLLNLRLDRTVVVAAFLADGSSSGEYLVTPSLERSADIAIKLWIRSPGFVAGSVVDAAGQRVAGATIAFAPERDGTRGVTPRKPKGVVTESDGNFITAVDAPFSGWVRAEFADVTGPKRIVSVTPGRTATIELQLAHPDEPVLIHGAVRTAEGRNAAGSVVECRDAGGKAITVTADAIGSFLLQPEGRGRFELRASCGELVTPAAVVVICDSVASAQSCNLVVARGERIEGRVVDASGEAVADCRVVAVFEEAGATSWPGRIAAVGRSDATGHFAVAPLPSAAICTLVAAGPRDLCGSLRGVRPASGSVVLQLSRGLHLRGRIVDLVGRPIGESHVTLRPVMQTVVADALFPEWVAEARQSGVTCGPLEAGAFQIDVSAPGFEPASVRVDVVSDNQEVVVKMVPLER